MNTASAAKMLGVSPSTILRWIRQLDLDMNRNELGHYHFLDDDIYILKQIKEQVQDGKVLQEVVITDKKVRKGKVAATTIKSIESPSDILQKRVDRLERQLESKADQVVSYQLLSHRREIEDLEKEVHRLHMKIEQLEEKLAAPQGSTTIQKQKTEKRRNLFKLLFNF